MPLGCFWLAIQRLNAHLSHQTGHVLATDLEAFSVEQIP
jgi:hypothetical protein